MKEIEIPFGAHDSELKGWEYTIPEGMEAEIKDGKIVVREKESEDERIRKATIKLLNRTIALPAITEIDGIRVEQMIDYLEKQKEPLPIPNKFSGLKSLMLQYLQSAANRKDDAEIESDTDLFGRKILDYVWKYSDEQKEQKPAERFEEAREKYQVEWSEEDEKEIDNIISLLNSPSTAKLCPTLRKNAISWLRSLRPSWKPSEEQMKVLYGILVGCRGTWGKDTVTTMESLYQDLRKLM